MKRALGFPSVGRWLWVSVRKGFASGRAILPTTAIGAFVLCALLVPVFAVLAAIQGQTSGSSSSLSSITVEADTDPDQPRLTSEMRRRIEAIPGVDEVTAMTTASFYAGDDSAWIATAHVLRPSLLPPGITAEVAAKVTGSAIIAPERIDGTDLSEYVGGPMPIEYTRGTGESTGTMAGSQVTLLAVYDADWTGYGTSAVLADEEFVTKLVAERFQLDPVELLDLQGVVGVVVHAESTDQVSAVMQELRSMGFDPIRDSDRMGSLPGLLSVFPVLIALVGTGLGAVLISQTVGAVRSAAERRVREFALLRMRGYSVPEVQRLMVLDIAAGALVGATGGIAVGVPAGWLLMLQVCPPELRPEWGMTSAGRVAAIGACVVASIALVAVVSVAVAVARVMRTDPFLLVSKGS